ncbi:hypothetical protein ACFVSW_22055 [Neobacillus sp. NPDC058068]|uniref:hypothetical protein n=1 Tax=Neobacillus sp. NPDC058068 TaxID=3346325 RepID=UPI0036D8E5BE
MKKSKIFIVAILCVFLLVGMSACSNSSSDVTSTKNQSIPDNISQKTDHSSQSNDSSTDSTAKSDNSSNNDSDSTSKNSNSNVSYKKDEEKLSQNSNKPDVDTSTKNQSKPDNTAKTYNNGANSKGESTIGDNDTYISSGEEAVQYLKQHLKEGTDDDVSFGVDETLRTDDNGTYYTIQLVSISTRVSGKTGTLGYYKVYQDGTYKLL